MVAPSAHPLEPWSSVLTLTILCSKKKWTVSFKTVPWKMSLERHLTYGEAMKKAQVKGQFTKVTVIKDKVRTRCVDSPL